MPKKPKAPKLLERDVKDALMKLIRWPVKLYNNPRGGGKMASGNFMKFGLGDGASDLIGWRTVVITPDMVGKRFAQFVACELKRPGGGVVTDDQMLFLTDLANAGGLAILADDADQAARDLGLIP